MGVVMLANKKKTLLVTLVDCAKQFETHSSRLIGYTYELLRCLDVEIWQFSWWQWQQTDRPIVCPCTCVRVNKVEVVTLLRFLLKQYCILPKISPLQKYKLPPLFDLQVIARIFTVLVSPHSYATKIASSARIHEWRLTRALLFVLWMVCLPHLSALLYILARVCNWLTINFELWTL